MRRSDRLASRRTLPLLVLVLPLLTGCALSPRRGQRPPFKKLSPPVGYEMMRDTPEMLVLDLRSAEEYNGSTGHIRRSQNIPLDQLAYHLRDLSAFRDETLLIYCRADDCGEKGMAILLTSGFENAVLLDGGIDAWIRSGFKTVLPDTDATRAQQPTDGRGPLRPARPGEVVVAPERDVPAAPPPI